MFADDFPLYWKVFASFMIKFSDKILCVSTPIKTQFKENPKLEVLHNGIDLAEFDISKTKIQLWREILSVAEKVRLVGVASRISPWKGQDIFLKACASVKEKVQKVHFLIIGDAFEGNEYLIDRLKEIVETNGLADHVTFTGFVDDPRSLIATLDILVLPSVRPDPFPGIILEGMALGVPVVATNIGGSIEQVENGRTGFLVPPSDPDGVASAILKLLNDVDLRKSMGKAGRERVAREFTLERTRRRLEDIYQGLAGNKLAKVP
jgi:glycosyltransferase involved in cell wall biosynthesis